MSQNHLEEELIEELTVGELERQPVPISYLKRRSIVLGTQ